MALIPRNKKSPGNPPFPKTSNIYREQEVERLVILAWEDGWNSVTFTRYDDIKSKSGPGDFWKKHKKK